LEVLLLRSKIVILGIACLIICAYLSGCNEENDNATDDEGKFIGTWLGAGNQLVFFENGNGSLNQYLTTWEIKDGKLIVYFTHIAFNLTSEYIFSNNDTTLTLFDTVTGDPIIYTKQ
jgi:hypothetical protein